MHIIIITWTKLQVHQSPLRKSTIKTGIDAVLLCSKKKLSIYNLFKYIYIYIYLYNELYKGNWLICSYVIFYCDSTAPGIRIPVCCIYILVLNALKMSLMIKKFVSSQKRRFIQVIRPIFSDDSLSELAIVGLYWSRLQMICTDSLLISMDIILPWK